MILYLYYNYISEISRFHLIQISISFMFFLLLVLLPDYHQLINDLDNIKPNKDLNNRNILSKYKKKSEIKYHIYDITSGNDISLNIQDHVSKSNSILFPSSNPEFCILLNKVQYVNRIVIDKVLKNRNFIQDYVAEVSIIDNRGEITRFFNDNIICQEDNVIEIKSNQENIKGFIFKLKSKNKSLVPVEIGRIRIY